jgi:hypothetical protein
MVTGVLALLEATAGALISALQPRASLVAENLALRKQLALLRVGRRPRLRPIDRAFWVLLGRVWSRWVDVLAIVKPATVIGWHRQRVRTILGVQVPSPRTSARGVRGHRAHRQDGSRQPNVE